MKHLILAAALFLTACSHTSTPPGVEHPKVPDLPAYYQEKATSLPPIVDPGMGNLAIDSAETSEKYNEVAHRYNGLVDLYNCVKESINQKKVADTCKSSGD